MKLLIILLFVSSSLFSQDIFKMTKSEIIKEYNTETITTDDGYQFEVIDGTSLYRAFHFEGEKLKLLLIIPKSQQLVNKFIEDFNLRYTIINETEWISYTEVGLIGITAWKYENRYVLQWERLEN